MRLNIGAHTIYVRGEKGGLKLIWYKVEFQCEINFFSLKKTRG